MNVLILSGKFGMGHKMAATAIGEEIKRCNSKANIIEVDLIDYLYPKASTFIYKGFRMLVERCHCIYNMIYRFSRKVEVDVKPSGINVYKKLRCLFDQWNPDIIVCTLPLCAKSVSTYKEKTGCTIPLVTCVTDISTHREWVIPHVETYLVPTQSIKDNLMRRGILKEHIHVTGIPVRQQFMNQQVPSKKEDATKEVLVMGGGLGLLPDMERLVSVLHMLPNVKATIITGTNQKLCEKWQRKYEDIEVLGYVENISTYMKRADLVITKVGGITLFEMIYSQVPVFVIHPFLEQEIYNAKFVEANDLGKVVWNRFDDYVDVLESFLMDEEELTRVTTNMRNAKKQIIETELSQVVQQWGKRGVA